MAKQGGVHVSYLVVAIVICLGLVGFAVALNNERQATIVLLDGQTSLVAETNARLKASQEEVFRARKVLTGDESNVPDYERFTTILAAAPDEWAKVTGRNKVNFRSIDEFLTVAYDGTRHWRSEYETQRAAADTKDSEFLREVESRETIVAGKMDEINQLKGRNENLQTQLESAETDGRDTARRLREQIELSADESRIEIARKDREIWVLRNQLGQSRRRISHLESEIVSQKNFDEVDPDGQVIQVADELGFAWVNLGRRDRLRAGLVFDVFAYVKGGKKLRKGQIEIMSVEDEIAKARVLGTLDSFNPISSGDYVTSPFYSKTDVPTFVFAGDKLANSRYSLEEIERRITDYGGKVEREVRIETTFVVAIDGYEASPVYATARSLGITILGERDLLNFVGY